MMLNADDWPNLAPENVCWVLTPAALGALHSSIRGAGTATDRKWWLTYDLESTGLYEHAPDARVVSIAITLAADDAPMEAVTWILGLSHPEGGFAGRWVQVLTELAQTMLDSGLPTAGQNIRFDARWVFAHTGVDLVSLIAWDTGLSSHLLDENWSTSLKARAEVTFSIPRWDDFDFKVLEADQRREHKRTGVPPKRLLAERVPYFELGLYNARDTHWTWALCALHRDQMNGKHLDHDMPEDRSMLRLGRFVKQVGTPMVHSITDMEQTGWLLDRDWTRTKLIEYEDEAAKAYATLEAMSPGCPDDYDLEFPPPRSYESGSLWFEWWSGQMLQLGQLRVLETSAKTNAPSWTKSVLTRLERGGSDAATTLLAYRRSTKRAQFLRSWLDASARTGRIHATYSYYRVRTGRTSCGDPNLQQVTKDLRPAFVADPGHLLIDADESQVELRVAAFVADCKPMIAAYERGDDLHRLMAAAIMKKRPEDITTDERQKAKAVCFGFLYLQQPAGFMGYAADVYEVEYTLEEATAARNAFFSTWEGMAEWHAKVERQVLREECLWAPQGRCRRFPGIGSMDDYDQGHAVRQAVNFPVQSFASDLLQLAVAKIRRESREAGMPVAVLGMIHDAVIGQVPQAQAEEAAALIHRCMTKLDEELLALGVRLPVPLDTEIKISERWGGEGTTWKP